MKSKTLGLAGGALRLSLAISGCLVVGQPWVFGEELFSEDEIFDITIQTPLKKLMRQSKDAPDVVGSIELEDGRSIPMTCNKYGISRLRECELASLAFYVEDDDVRGTTFEGQSILRMVTPCRLRGNYDTYTVLEYLVYRSYAVIADPAIRVRLVRAHFRDREKPTKKEIGFGFFIEDIGDAARRSGLTWLDIQSQRLSDLDPAQLTVMTLFQYMIGNTDWSAVVGRPDDRCCHNVAVFGTENVSPHTVVPFDFDQTGMVNPPYAGLPDASLGIRRVTDRKYRGLCVHNSELPAAIAVFNEKRPELEALFKDDSLPYPKARLGAIRYIEQFYDTINDPRKLDRNILGVCR